MARESLISKLKGKLIVGIVIGALVYLVLVIYSGWSDLTGALARFPWALFPVLLLLSFANYLFRFRKWDYYLRKLQIEVPKTDSLIVFLSGLIMTISPGKIGELLKTVILKQIKGTPISKSAPIVLAERLTDFIALVIISTAGLARFAVGDYILIVVVVVVLLVGFVVVISHRGLSMFLLGLLEGMPVIGKFAHKFHEAYDSMYVLVGSRPLAVATFWSLLAWMCECTGFFIVLRAFGAPAPLLTASFIYAIGTIVGAVSPGGLGFTEGSMVGLLQTTAVMGAATLDSATASAATMIIRIATLWFAVFVGAIVLLGFQKRFAGAGELLEEELEERKTHSGE